MMTKTLLAGATALTLALPAFAQTTTPSPATPATPPAQQQQQQMPQRDQAAPSATTQSGIQFIQMQQRDQWLASNFMDRSVYGTDGNRIGDVNDVLVDRNGQVVGVVIGVGGFLGIGEKNVAIPFRSIEIQPAPSGNTAQAPATNTTTGSPSNTAGGAASTSAQAPAGSASMTTASNADLWSDDNARLVIRATRDELRNAPAFTEWDDRSAQRNTNTNGNAAPRTPATPSTPATPAR